MPLKIIPAALMSALFFAGCGADERIRQLEEQVELNTLLVYQLQSENDSLKSRLRKVSRTSRSVAPTVAAPAAPAVPPLEKSKKQLYIMQMKLMNYQLLNESIPDTVQELKGVLGRVPLESRSQSNIIHLERNGRGGWIYDPDEGTLEINTWRSQ